MSDGYIDAQPTDKDACQQQQAVEVNLNIGVFFDGTNNNKVQSMIALNSRRKKFFKKYKQKIKEKYPEGTDFYSLKRDELESHSIGTIDELDNVFGLSDAINLDVEKTIATDNLSEYRYSSAAEKYDGHDKNRFWNNIVEFFVDDARREKLSRMAGNAASKFVIFKSLASLSSSKGSGYTNVAILNSLYETSEGKNDEQSGNTSNKYYSIYIEGSGANEEINVIRQLMYYPKAIIGLGFGVDDAGLIEKCRKCIQRVKDIYETYAIRKDVSVVNCYFDVFGFSRGATTARCFTYILNPKKNRNYVDKDINNTICGTNDFLLGDGSKKLGKKNVRTLGLYDTVSSIGILREPTSYLIGEKLLKTSEKSDFQSCKSIYHDTNVDDFGLHSTNQAESVLHICALDEFRKNFALVNIESSIKTNGTEVYIPGCHTDIGGGASIGLDDFKIINCDEIATRGAIIYNFYVRVAGILESLYNLKALTVSMMTLVASASDVVTLPLAYKTAQAIIPEMHGAVKGLFSFITGHESMTSYKIKNNRHVSKHVEAGIDGYSFIADFVDYVDSVNNVKQTAGAGVNKGVSAVKSMSSRNMAQKVLSVKDIIETAIEIVKVIRQSVECVKQIESDLDKLNDSRQKHNLKDDVRYIVDCEIQKWKAQRILLEEAAEMLDAIFNGTYEDAIITIEQRRICLYNGVPNISSALGANGGGFDMGLVEPVCAQTLKNMGWIENEVEAEKNTTYYVGRPSEECIENAKAEGKSILVEKTKVAHFFTRDNIGVCKYSRPGYTLIGLKAMHAWASKKGCKFKVFPENIFKIQSDLLKFYKKVESATKSVGRKICVPMEDDEYNYKYLRQKYLHISLNQQILSFADNGVVNGPSFVTAPTRLTPEERKKLISSKTLANPNVSYEKDNVITRRIYPGIKNSPCAGGKEYIDAPKKYCWYLV